MVFTDKATIAEIPATKPLAEEAVLVSDDKRFTVTSAWGGRAHTGRVQRA